MGTGFLKKKKEAKAMQQQLVDMQSKMDTLEYEGSAGNGLVSVTMMGNGTIKSVRIKPDCIDKEDPDGLQDLIKAAFNAAKKKLDEQSIQGMGAMKGFAGFPGF